MRYFLGLLLLVWLSGCGSGVSEPGGASAGSMVRSREHLAQQAAAVSVSLRPGWNAVAFQCPRLTSLSAPASATALATYDATGYRSGAVTLEEVNSGEGARRGFWVLAQADAALTYDGGADGQGNRIVLRSGWNLVSLGTTQSVAVNRLRGGALPTIFQLSPEGTATQVDVMQPGRPCWMFANSPATLTWDEAAAVALEVNPSKLSLRRFSTAQLTATARFADGTRRDVTELVQWTSSIPSAGAVSSTGLVTALQAGSIELTAALDGLSARCGLTVTDASVPGGGPTPTPTPAPALTGIAPLFATTGTTVTLTGTSLTGATAVSFGGTAATSFTPVSATQVDAVVPSGTGGTQVAVTVTTPGGTSNSVNFGYNLVLGAGAHNFNTTTGILDGGAAAHPAWDGTKLALPGSFTLTGSLNVTGTQAFEVTSPGNIVINNTVNATGQPGGDGILIMAFSGIGGAAGPGGGAGGSRGGYMNSTLNAAAGGAGVGVGPGGVGGGGGGDVPCRPGGGGGHAAAGESGLGVTPGEGAGGASYTSIPTARLGGSGGGAGGTGTTVNSFCGGGGGGGGVVILTAAGSLTGTGTIDVSGGRGGSGTGPAPAESEANAGGPGGGGAGGSILLTGVPVPTFGAPQLKVGGGARGTVANFPGPPGGVLPARLGGAGAAGRAVQQ